MLPTSTTPASAGKTYISLFRPRVEQCGLIGFSMCNLCTGFPANWQSQLHW